MINFQTFRSKIDTECMRPQPYKNIISHLTHYLNRVRRRWLVDVQVHRCKLVNTPPQPPNDNSRNDNNNNSNIIRYVLRNTIANAFEKRLRTERILDNHYWHCTRVASDGVLRVVETWPTDRVAAVTVAARPSGSSKRVTSVRQQESTVGWPKVPLTQQRVTLGEGEVATIGMKKK